MPKCILIIDDDPLTVDLARGTLENNGYEVLMARDGVDAFAAMKHKKPDLILLDVQMPKMNGYAFMIEKLKVPELAGIPVIVLTSSKETAPLFKRHGVKDYLIKPFEPALVLERIKTALQPKEGKTD